MATLSSANTKYTAEQLTKATGISAETLATWGLTEATDTLTMSQLAEIASSDAQAKKVLEKIVAQNAQAVANGEVTASNVALATSEGSATLATGAFTTAIKANIKAMWTWMTTTPIGWLTLLAGGVATVIGLYDLFTTSVKEQKEAMEDSLSAYEDAKSELSSITTELETQTQTMNELLAKEKLTYAEKGQLEELQAITQELLIQKDLAEKEEGRTKKEVATDTSDLFKKQFGKYDISESAINEYQNNADITGNNAILISDENDISAMIAGYRQFNELLNEAYGEGNQENIDHFKSLTDDLKDSIFTTAKDLQEQQSNISDYYNTIKDVPYEELTSDQKEIVDSYNAISNAIALIYKQLDPNTWNTMQIDNLFATDGIEKTKEELIEMAKAGTLDETTIKSYSKLNSTLENSNMVLNNGQSAASALCNELYALADAEGSVEESAPDKTDILSFSDVWNSGDFENARKELLSLAEAGRLTPETLQSTEEYKKLLEQTGMSAEEAAKKINSMTDASTQLQSMSEQISKMSDMLADKKNGTVASASDLASFDATVKGLESWDEFERVMMSSKSSMKQCQQAANDLATEWVNSNNFLSNLNDTNKDYYITQLKNMGIENAEAVVTGALTQKERELAAQTEYETLATEYNSDAKNRNNQITTDLANATIAEIAEIIAEGNVTADTTAIMAEFALSKIDVNNAQIDTSSDIEQIVAIANAAGASAEYVDALRVALNNLQKAEEGKKGVNDLPLAGISAQMANTSAEINVAAARDDVESALNDIKNQIKENRIDPSDYIIKPSGSRKYKPSGGSGGSRGGSKTKETKQTIDWIERKITILNNKIDAFATKASDAWSSWTSRTKALNSEMETTKKLLTSVYGVSDKLQKKYNKQKSTAKIKLDNYVKDNSKVLTSSTIKKINNGTLDTSKLSKKDKKVVEKYKKLQKDYEKKAKKASQNPAADYYFSKANSVAKKYKLSPAIIKKIKNGTINISDYNQSMANVIQKYQDYYDKGKDAQKSKKEAKQKLNELAQQNFELIQSKWDSRIGYQENRKNAVSDALNLAQSKGQLIGSAYYTKQKGINNKKINKYKQEETELKKAMKNVPKYSEQWYNMKYKISEVHSKYVQLQADNAELQNSINELKFDRFDELINKFDDITDETNFLIDMLDSDNLFNSDNGSITNDGITAMGLTAQNYDVYLAQVEEYKNSIADLDRMYKNGEIGISDYNSKMRELQEGYRNSIKSANDAKKAVIDYVKQGLDAQNEALSKEIEQRKKLLEQAKTERDFNDKTLDQNKKIARLKRQIAILENDDSDSNRKTLRELRSQLQDVEKEQSDSFYDKSVSDQEDALDNMLENSKKQAEEYLKDTDKVFADAIVYVNAHADQVSTTLTKLAQDTGYNISEYITKAWRGSGSAVGDYASTMSKNVPKITQQIALITGAWEAQCLAAEKAAKASAKAAAGTDETTKDTDKKGNSSNGSCNMSKSSSKTDIKKYITNHADKTKQKKSYYGVLNQYIYDKTGGKVLSVKEEVELAKMLGVSVKKDLSGTGDRQKILDALKKKKIAFANGGVLGDLVKLTGEDGLFIGSAGESILTKEQTQALIDFRPAIPQLNTMVDLMKNAPISSASQSPTYNIEVSNNVSGAVSQETLNEMRKIATNQAETVIKKINSATYAKGVRR